MTLYHYDCVVLFSLAKKPLPNKQIHIYFQTEPIWQYDNHTCIHTHTQQKRCVTNHSQRILNEHYRHKSQNGVDVELHTSNIFNEEKKIIPLEKFEAGTST